MMENLLKLIFQFMLADTLNIKPWLCGVVLLLHSIMMQGQTTSIKKQWIVKLKSERQTSVDDFRILGLNAKAFSHMANARSDRPVKSIYVVSGTDSVQYIVRKLQDLNMIEYVEQDAIGYATGIQQSVETDDPTFYKQWYLRNDGTMNIFGIQARSGADISTIAAWAITTGDSTITIAILDTGVSQTHPEFENRFWRNKQEIPDNSIDDDKNGFVDDIHGWNFINDGPNVEDDNGHGTAIAGTIAANPDNNVAIAGINWKSKLMICKVLERDQSGYYSDWAAGIYYAVDNGANIINMSVAGEEDLKTLANAISYAYDHGVLVVCSTGNDNSERAYYPAAYASTLAVGSTDPDDSRSISFNGNFSYGSNYGNHLDIVAPGNVIYGLNRTSFSANTLWGGTSMSSAVVTGVASLLLSKKNDLTPVEIKGILVSTADDEVGKEQEDVVGWDKYYGFGRVNSVRALNQVFSDNNFPEPDDIMLFPNPASREINISAWLPSATAVTIYVLDAQGKIWSRQSQDISSPLLNVTLDLTEFQSSMYILIIEQEGRKLMKRFVVVRK